METSTTDMIAAATAYLEALVQRDPSLLAVAADVRRVVNGRRSADGAEALREAIRHEPPITIDDSRRWIVGADELVVFYDLSADMGEPAPITATVGERFGFRAGKICEIEAVHTITPGIATVWSDQLAAGATADGLVPAVRSYLDALVSHRADAVTLDDQVRRVENGDVTGDGGVHLRAELESDVMQMVQGISNERWVTGGDSVAVFYELSAGSPDEAVPVLIAERFRVGDGALTEIEAIFAMPKGQE